MFLKEATLCDTNTSSGSTFTDGGNITLVGRLDDPMRGLERETLDMEPPDGGVGTGRRSGEGDGDGMGEPDDVGLDPRDGGGGGGGRLPLTFKSDEEEDDRR